jgi:hypothetical protein
MADQNTVSATLHGLLCLAVILITAAAYAGDEDMSPNAYQQFDPVTGYMIPVDDSSAPQRGHAAPGDAAAGNSADLPGSESKSSAQPPGWVYLLVAVLIVAFVVWVKRKSKVSGSTLI